MKLNDNLQEKLNKEARALKELTQIFDCHKDSREDQKKRKDEIFFKLEINKLNESFAWVI